MRKLHKVVVVVAALGSVSFIGAGTASAGGWGRGGHGFDIKQINLCRSHDVDLGLADNIALLPGAFANIFGGHGSPGAQLTRVGSNVSCHNSAF